MAGLAHEQILLRLLSILSVPVVACRVVPVIAGASATAPSASGADAARTGAAAWRCGARAGHVGVGGGEYRRNVCVLGVDAGAQRAHPGHRRKRDETEEQRVFNEILAAVVRGETSESVFDHVHRLDEASPCSPSYRWL